MNRKARGSGGQDVPRFALRQREAAKALGICEKKFRELRPQIPHFYLDSILLFPVDGLREWVSAQARQREARTDEIARELLGQKS